MNLAFVTLPIKISLNQRRQNYPISPIEIPLITKTQFSQLQELTNNEAPEALKTLTGRVQYLQKFSSTPPLGAASRTGAKNKLIALSITALYVGLIAGAVLGFMAASPWVGPLLIAVAVLYGYACSHKGGSLGVLHDLAAPLYAPFVLSYRVAGAADRKALEVATEKAAQDVEASVTFWRDHTFDLSQKISLKIKNCDSQEGKALQELLLEVQKGYALSTKIHISPNREEIRWVEPFVN